VAIKMAIPLFNDLNKQVIHGEPKQLIPIGIIPEKRCVASLGSYFALSFTPLISIWSGFS
jgi:hypothetical protein